MLQVFDEEKNARALNDLWSFVCTEVPEISRTTPPPTTWYVRTTKKKVKLKKAERKARRKTLLLKYNKSLDVLKQLATELYEYKYQKMAALGFTTTTRLPRTKTTISLDAYDFFSPKYDTPEPLEHSEEESSESETKSTTKRVPKIVTNRLPKSSSESMYDDVSKSISKSVPKKANKKKLSSSESDESIRLPDDESRSGDNSESKPVKLKVKKGKAKKYESLRSYDSRD